MISLGSFLSIGVDATGWRHEMGGNEPKMPRVLSISDKQIDRSK
jgi:hypothetical protein